jgi:hypothetical protein
MARIGHGRDRSVARSRRRRILGKSQYWPAATTRGAGLDRMRNYWLPSAFVLALVVAVLVLGLKFALAG